MTLEKTEIQVILDTTASLVIRLVIHLVSPHTIEWKIPMFLGTEPEIKHLHLKGIQPRQVV